MTPHAYVGERRLPHHNWRDRGLCHGKTDLFFGPPRERPGRRRAREAKAGAYCRGLPVVAECRSWARINHENGFWGGETEERGTAAAGYPPRSIERRSVAATRAS